MVTKQATEYVRGLRYKLQAIGISVIECAYIYGDNKSVLVNSAIPHSQLKKMSNSVAFHHVQEGSVLDEWRATYINTHENIADLLTKNLPSGEIHRLTLGITSGEFPFRGMIHFWYDNKFFINRSAIFS